jgi:hypothetical protein
VSIDWFRDLVICIFGLGATVVVIFLAILALSFYLKVRPVLDSLKKTTKTAEKISSCVESEIIGPLSQVAAFAQGIRQASSLVGRFNKKKEADKNE